MNTTCIRFFQWKSSNIKNRMKTARFASGYEKYQNSIQLKDIDTVDRRMCYVDIPSADLNLNPSIPILLLAGTAQTSNTWSQHFRSFSKSHRLILPELRCQGETDLLSQYGHLDQQLEDCMQFLDKLGISKVHVIGFSFGGRVAIGLGAKYPDRIKTISVTGVPYIRDALGRSILTSWRETLASGAIALPGCAWSFVLNGFSREFIERNEKRLSTYVDGVSLCNNAAKLYDLLATSNLASEWEAKHTAKLINCPVQVIGGLDDRISSIETVKELASNINQSEFHEINAGHLCPFESPKYWRDLVLNFINKY